MVYSKNKQIKTKLNLLTYSVCIRMLDLHNVTFTIKTDF